MSNYHITQEQLRKLATEIDVAGANVTVFENGDIEVFGTKGLLQIVNSALDKVLGEPVGIISQYKESICHVELPEGTKLYAPKELSCPTHKWDKSGEKCLVCGDKDWMG